MTDKGESPRTPFQGVGSAPDLSVEEEEKPGAVAFRPFTAYAKRWHSFKLVCIGSVTRAQAEALRKLRFRIRSRPVLRKLAVDCLRLLEPILVHKCTFMGLQSDSGSRVRVGVECRA